MSALDLDARRDGDGHIVAFYDGERDLIDAIAAFLEPGIDQGGSAVVIATAPHRKALEAALVDLGFPVDALAAAGRYRSFDARATLDAFMRDGAPDPERFAASVGTIIADAAGVGSGVRAFGEMVALLWDDGNVAGAVALESLWNAIGAQHAFMLLCAYPASVLEGADDLGAAKLVCEQHTQVVSLPGAVDDTTLGGRDDVVRSFPPTPLSLHIVRAFVADTLRAWRSDDHVVERAAVVTTELATNAIAHARSPFRVSLSRTPSTVQIAVRDASNTWPRAQHLNAARMSGRGIVLVGALADDWGTRVEPDGKTVWAALSLRSH